MLKKERRFRWGDQTDGMVEVSLNWDHKGFHWLTSLWKDGEPVISMSDYVDGLPADFIVQMTMMRDEILDDLKRDFDRELASLRNDLIKEE